jgi:hypothetical protein
LSFVSSRGAVTAENVETLEAAGAGGRDTAVLHDSPGDDRYFGAPEQSRLVGAAFDYRLAGFAAIQVRSSSGYDTAILADSTGNDTFVGKPETAMLEGAGFRQDLFGFAGVRVLGGRGEDQALLSDGAGADWLFARPGMAWMTGRGYQNFVAGFDEVRADARAGGYDLAWLFDSPGDDHLTSQPGEVRFLGEGFRHTAAGFETVRAASTAGHDRADFFRAQSEEFRVEFGQAMQRAGGYLNLAFDFARVERVEIAEVRQAAFASFLEREEEGSLPQILGADTSRRDPTTRAVGAVFRELGA